MIVDSTAPRPTLARTRPRIVGGSGYGSAMTKLEALLQRILDLAPSYTFRPSPAMRERDASCLELRHRLVDVLSGDAGLAALDLEAAVGGHQGSYGPVPWVRVFSRAMSPNATAGIYLAYLFAADGLRAYLSLQQGSSELRAGRMRPVSDAGLLRANGAAARSSIRELIESPLGAGLAVKVDLASSHAPVKQYARQRIANYEHANILAIQYESRDIPPEDDLLDDLGRMLTLLAALYGVAVPRDSAVPPIDSAEVKSSSESVDDSDRIQGLLRDTAVRRAVEIYAEDSAETYLTERGWNVQRVGHLKLGYDLECCNSHGHKLHVEVKGTQSGGEEVFLTQNEVMHLYAETECPGQHALYVLSEIEVVGTGKIDCRGGKRTCLWPWTMDRSLLTPTAYAYRVPDSPY